MGPDLFRRDIHKKTLTEGESEEKLMGLLSTLPVASGSRFRDDYGATCFGKSAIHFTFRRARKFPVEQSAQIVTVGGHHHAK